MSLVDWKTPKVLSSVQNQRPVRSTQGTTAEPPPQTPALQVSPVVQSRRSSHAAPSPAGVQIEGSPLQTKHGSIRHSASQPSPLVWLPS